jgi:hypothetical protein
MFKTSSSNNWQKYPFDVLINRVPCHPDMGQLIRTYYGSLIQLPNGELAFEPECIIRHRHADGRSMSFLEFIEQALYTEGWDIKNIASFLEYVHEHRNEFRSLIQQAPPGRKPTIQRLSLMWPGHPRTATGVSQELRTSLDFKVPEPKKQPNEE